MRISYISYFLCGRGRIESDMLCTYLFELQQEIKVYERYLITTLNKYLIKRRHYSYQDHYMFIYNLKRERENKRWT